MSEVVCVTGGSGFIGSWLVRLLLDRGYTVHATVQNLNDEKETKHLESMEEGSGSASETTTTATARRRRLRLFQVDLLDYDSLLAAIAGTVGVFHLASPFIVDRVQDPQMSRWQKFIKLFHVGVLQKRLLEPAVKGTINVLKAAKESGVKKVVVTSSVSAIVMIPKWLPDVVINEECWTDLEFCYQNELWYAASKTLAEKAAWEFAEESGLNIVVVHPGVVMGPILPPVINASMSMLVRLIQGHDDVSGNYHLYARLVHVKDVAKAHILVYENPTASGRHLCVEAFRHYNEFVAKFAELYPEYNVPRLPKDNQPGFLRAENASKKLIDLGLQFIPLEQIISDSVESLRSRGYIS